jgi:hypothetical protein
VSHIRRFSPDFGKDQHVDLNGQTVLLPDVNARTLEIVFDWMYTGKFTLPELTPNDESELRGDLVPYSAAEHSKETSPASLLTIGKANRQWSLNGIKTPSPDDYAEMEVDTRGFSTLLNLYIFAQSHGFQTLRNEVVKKWQALDKKNRAVLHINHIHRAYKSLPEDSALLKLIAVIHAADWAVLGKRPTKAFPVAFTEDVYDCTLSFQSRDPLKVNGPNNYRRKPCVYHEHLDQVEKDACRAELAAARELETLRKRKMEFETELPKLQERVEIHTECLQQYEVRKKLDAKIKRDKDGLFTSVSS